jgi:hypothetical protein
VSGELGLFCKKWLICRGFSTDVEGAEGRIQNTEDRRQMIDDKFLLHKEFAGCMKCKILIHYNSLRTILVFGIFFVGGEKTSPL